MTAADHTKDLSLSNFNLPLLRGGPLYSLLVRTGIVRSERASNRSRILFFMAVTWVATGPDHLMARHILQSGDQNALGLTTFRRHADFSLCSRC